MLTSQQFGRTRRLALSLAGIELVERHRELLDRRRRRVGVLDSAGLDSLLGVLEIATFRAFSSREQSPRLCLTLGPCGRNLAGLLCVTPVR